MEHARRYGSLFGQPRRASAAAYGAAALLAVASAYVMLLARPELVGAAAAFWGKLHFAQDAPSWALPAISAGVAIGCAAAGIALLSMFVRGVQEQPYVWLAPVLVGFSTLVLVGTPIALPWPSLASEAFALLSGFALLGGGAVMQMRGGFAKGAGGVLVALPAITLGAGYATLRAGFGVLPRFEPSAQLFLFVLVSTSCGVAFVALVTRRADPHPRQGALRDHGGEAFARAHAAELRATAAEHRAFQLEQEMARRSADEAADFRAMARPGLSAWVVSAIAAALLGGATAALFFGVYRPMASRAAAASAFVADARRDHAAELAAQRKRSEADIAGLKAQLAAERQRAEGAAAAEQAAKEALARAATPAPVVEPVVAPAPASKTKVTARARTQRAKAHAKPKRAARADRAEKRAKPAAAAAAAEEPEFDRETRRALRDSVSDDPIEGL